MRGMISLKIHADFASRSLQRPHPTLNQDKGECETWQRRAKRLARELDTLRRRLPLGDGSITAIASASNRWDSEGTTSEGRAALGLGAYLGLGEDDPGGVEALGRHLERLDREIAAEEAARVARRVIDTDGTTSKAEVVQPTPAQERVMAGLLSRGQLSGWLVNPSEV